MPYCYMKMITFSTPGLIKINFFISRYLPRIAFSPYIYKLLSMRALPFLRKTLTKQSKEIYIEIIVNGNFYHLTTERLGWKSSVWDFEILNSKCLDDHRSYHWSIFLRNAFLPHIVHPMSTIRNIHGMRFCPCWFLFACGVDEYFFLLLVVNFLLPGILWLYRWDYFSDFL